jgi:acyl-CoA reductase-like NAD-dependent aldehyde dehydrogenase
MPTTKTRAARPTRTIPCHEPATSRTLGEIAVDTPDAVFAALGRARRVQPALGSASLKERARLLERLLARVVADTDEIVELVVRDAGKTREHAIMGEVWPVCEKLRWTIKHGPRHLAPERVSSGLLPHKRARIEYRPLGVQGAIVPWNYPFQNLMNPIVSGLMAGNAVVVKPSEWVAYSSERFASMVREEIAAAGFDPDLVQVVQGYAETGQALIASGIDALLFIGSAENGKRVLETAAKHLVPVILELGGKDPLVVFEDGNIEAAAHAALNGAFINAGQNCVAAERILVHESVMARFEETVGGLARGLRQGPPGEPGSVDVGAMITPLQLDRVEKLVDAAVDEGARVVAGGRRRAGAGSFFEPTVLSGLRPDMDIMTTEELFGPVMLLCPFRDEAHAIEIANSTPFGLSASVFSRDRKRAARVVSALRSGMAAVNDFGGMTYMAQDLPFGGVKASGFGRMNGRDGLRACTEPRAVLDDRLPFTFPNKLFPVTPGTYRGTRAAISIVYGGARERLAALGALFGGSDR